MLLLLETNIDKHIIMLGVHNKISTLLLLSEFFTMFPYIPNLGWPQGLCKDKCKAN